MGPKANMTFYTGKLTDPSFETFKGNFMTILAGSDFIMGCLEGDTRDKLVRDFCDQQMKPVIDKLKYLRYETFEYKEAICKVAGLGSGPNKAV